MLILIGIKTTLNYRKLFVDYFQDSNDSRYLGASIGGGRSSIELKNVDFSKAQKKYEVWKEKTIKKLNELVANGQKEAQKVIDNLNTKEAKIYLINEANM